MKSIETVVGPKKSLDQSPAGDIIVALCPSAETF